MDVKTIEESIRKEFSSVLLSRFKKAIEEYRLIQQDDKIAVCISGGKDSMLMAKLFQETQRQLGKQHYGKIRFDLVFLVMDPGYSPENRKHIENNAELMGIPITVFETNIFNYVSKVENNPCFLCARIRRGNLFAEAQKLGCNKIALGHHFDDVIETILMGMIYGGQVQTMLPKLHSDNYEGMQLIRPMYLIREADITRWTESLGLNFIRCACRFTEKSSELNNETLSKRLEIKHLIAELAKGNPQIEKNIFRSVENVNLKKIMSYKSGNEIHSFLDKFEE